MTYPSAKVAGKVAMASSARRRWWALTAIAASVFVVGLDLTVLNLALPTISVDLHAGIGDLQWIADAYTLVLAATILPAGLLGDRYGRKKILLVALVIFGLASAACSYATGTGELIAARALLGIGAAGISPISLAVIPVLFAPNEQKKAIAIISAAIVLSFPLGPIVGGYLLGHFWWGSVFLINLPVALVAIAAVVCWLPESRSSDRPRVDVPGVITSSAGLTALTFGFIRAGQHGWGDLAALAALAIGAGLLALFVLVERRVAARGRIRPLADLRLFVSGDFRLGTVLVTLVSFVIFGLMFAMPLYFQEVRGADAMGSGIRLLPLVGGMTVGMAGTRVPVIERAGARAGLTVGFLVLTVAIVLGALTAMQTSAAYTATWITVAGLGLGLVMPSAMNLAVGALSPESSGSGSALVSALRQVGATIGVAVLGTVINNGYAARLDLTGLPPVAAQAAHSGITGGVLAARALRSPALLASVRSAYIGGMDIMLWACAGIALAGAALAALSGPRTSER